MRIAELAIAYIIIIANFFIPKHKNTMKRGIIFCDMGIGNFVFMMPIIKSILKKYELTLYAEGKEINDIIDNHFNCSRKISGKYDFSINNSFTMQKKKILKLLKLRIPLRIGHVFKNNKFNFFFNKRIPFNENNYELDQNYNLVSFMDVERENLFFEVSEYKHLKPYVSVQPRSSTDPGKNTDLRNLIIELSKESDVILIGHEKEKVNLPGINMIGKTSIMEAASIIKGSKHFYGLESGLSHIAVAMNVPTTIYIAKETPKRVLHKEAQYIDGYSGRVNEK